MPEIARAFLLNVKIFSIAEVFILIFALFLAVLRSLPGPVFFPLRALAIVYADLFRGMPTILVIAMLGFGAPALGLSYVPKSVVFWGIVSLVLIYSAYVSEVYRAGIESIHPSQEAAARSLGLSRWQTLRHVILPQAVRRVIPPLLNDFIGLQKDTALVGTLGAVEAFQQSQIDTNATFNFTAVPVRGASLRRDHDPARAVHRLADPARPAPAPGRRSDAVSDALVVERPLEVVRPHQVLRGIDLTVAEHEVVCLIGASGSGKSTLLRCINLLEPIDAGRIFLDGEEITARGGRERRAPPDRHRLPVVQPVPAHERAAERDARAARRARALEAARRTSARRLCSSASASPTSAPSIPTGSRAASSSASRSCARWRCSRT